MINGKRLLAVVPARSGSRGIPDKNMQTVGGLSLIARAGQVLADPSLSDIDARILSTDAQRYAEEGLRHGLACPFLRPRELARDASTALEMLQHAWRSAESHYACTFEVALIVEPTCPLRSPADVRGAIDRLFACDADSVVTVSRVDPKYNPYKVLRCAPSGRLEFFLPAGAGITMRQSVPTLYYRNGACYALSKRCVFEKATIVSDRTEALIIDRPLVNIDDPLDLRTANWLAGDER